MKIGVPCETTPGETRVAITPDVVSRLAKKDHEVLVQAGAGVQAAFPDAAYTEVGATIVEGAADLWSGVDLVAKVQPPRALDGDAHEVDLLAEGGALVSLLFPFTEHDLVRRLAERKVTSFALDRVPRITRAQSMDVLSSQSTVAGYKAVLIAAQRSPRFFPMLTTAAGTIPPGKVVVLGAGVAGLQAIATARRLGAVVKAYDIRAACKEQVESLGATFIDLGLDDDEDAETEGGYAKQLSEERQEAERQALAGFLADADVIVTTALVPGRPAPRLITDSMFEKLEPGTVILDMGAETGGNCSKTVPGEDVVVDGVLVLGPKNLPATMPDHASRMFGRNIFELSKLLAPEADFTVDLEDEVVVGCCITHEGEVIHPETKERLGEAS